MNIHSNKSLSQKLEFVEARANVEFIRSRLKRSPQSNAQWVEINGAYAMFDGPESPLTQTFGLGLFNPLTYSDLDAIEKFYNQFSAPIFHEVSPMVDSEHIEILSTRGYKPVEYTNVLYKILSNEKCSKNVLSPKVAARKLIAGEEQEWVTLNARGWSTEIPGLFEFMNQFSEIFSEGNGISPFFAEICGKRISTGILYINDGVALLAGDSTLQDGRNCGGQNALIDARLNYALAQGCSIAMLVASPGSQSQKNAEKNGFQIAYTRTKWKLVG